MLAGLLKYQNKLMSLVYPEPRRVAKRSHIVVLMAAIPNDQVIPDETNFSHEMSHVDVEGVENVLLT